MYEQATAENDRLREKFRKSEEDLRETKNTLEKLNTVVRLIFVFIFKLTTCYSKLYSICQK